MLGFFKVKWIWGGHSPLSVDQFIGARLRHMRSRANQTLNQVSILLRVSDYEIEKIEAGRRRATASQLFLLAQHFEVPVASFFDRREAPDELAS